MRSAHVLALCLMASCSFVLDEYYGSTEPPELHPMTWRDAEVIYADLYCTSYIDRCFPTWQFGKFGDDCHGYVMDRGCSPNRRDCDAAYPQDRIPDLQQCAVDMAEVGCGASAGPTSCDRALDE